MRTHKALPILILIAFVVIGGLMMGATVIPIEDVNIVHITGTWTHTPRLGWQNAGGKQLYPDTVTYLTTPVFHNYSNVCYHHYTIYSDTSVATDDDSAHVEWWMYASNHFDRSDTIFFVHDSFRAKTGTNGISTIDSTVNLPPNSYVWIKHHCDLDDADSMYLVWSVAQPKGPIWP